VAKTIEKSYVDPVDDKSCIYALNAPKISVVLAHYTSARDSTLAHDLLA
jgi:hypothetical protein